MSEWITDEAKTKEHWLELHTERHEYEVQVKWDGCIHFNDLGDQSTFDYDSGRYVLTDSSDYIHICHLDSFIALLTELRDTAKQHFGDDWGE